MEIESSRLALNVITTKRCNYVCPYCVEHTNRSSYGEPDWEDLSSTINKMDSLGMVTDTSLLGGDPLYYKGIIELIPSLTSKPIITTNGYRFVDDPDFFNKFRSVAKNIKALNISLPHYEEGKRAVMSGTGHSFSNEELKNVITKLSGHVNIRINTLLMRGYIDSLDEIQKMIYFTREIGVRELKIGELTGKDASIHGFIDLKTIQFNNEHYLPIPVESCYQKCHEEGATTFWKNENGVDVFFNAPPDELMFGGKDKNGNYYQRVLFEDGLIGYSWNRERDGATSVFPKK